MIRRCIHSLSLGLWPIQLPRRGSLGYVLLFLALSYLYRHTQKAFPFVGRGEVLRPSPPGAPQGRMRWRLPLAQCRTAAHWQAPPHQSRLRRSSFPYEGKPLGVYHVLTQYVNHVHSQGFGGGKPPPYGVRFICLPVGTPLPGRPENVAVGTVLPGKANGMIRGNE